MKITTDTKVFGAISGKASNCGAAMYNAGYAALGLNCVYIPFATADLEKAISGIRAFGMSVAVSMPFKQEVIKYLDDIDGDAKAIGAVNTVHNEGAKLKGYNSDWIGAIMALTEVTALKGKRAVILGAGGAARAIAYGLKKEGAHVTVLNRNIDKAKALVEDIKLDKYGKLSDLIEDYDILVNATPVGMSAKDESERIVSKVKPGSVVMDAVFFPDETPLIRLAKQNSCKIVKGARMLLYQGVFQFELFTGKKAPVEVMDKALRECLLKG
ncbi:MAG: shikimate dehydrogenase [Candidatus Woesearchaeota archaeon]